MDVTARTPLFAVQFAVDGRVSDAAFQPDEQVNSVLEDFNRTLALNTKK